MKRNILVASAFMTLCPLMLFGQQPNLKFGKPTKEEMMMTQYDKDTTAAAVVLCEITDVSYEVGYSYTNQKRMFKTRIKVLKPEGAKYADIKIPYYKDEPDNQIEMINELTVTSYNMVDGKIQKSRLPDNMIFDKQLDDKHFVKQFSVPNVKPGTVFEYEYDITSTMWGQIDPYYAQREIPVAYCLYKAEIPSIYQFNVECSSSEYFSGSVATGSLELKSSTSHYGSNNPKFVTNIYQAGGNHLPALKDDRYLWCPKDYCARIKFELRSIQYPGEAEHTFAKNWEDVDETILTSPYFGSYLNNHSKLKDEIMQSGIAGIQNFKDKVAALYVLMRKHVSWNGKYRLTPDAMVNPLKKGTGSNADLNMLFISMLNDLGIENYPVVMSSRSNGLLSKNFANLQHLNTFIVAVTDGSSTYYIDSSVDNGYLNVLPPELYVDRARKIGKKIKGTWVNLQNIGMGKVMVSDVVKVSASGEMTGSYTAKNTGNSAVDMREEYDKAKDSASYVQKLSGDKGIEITSYKIEGVKRFTSDVVETFSYKKQCDTSGDRIYINPFTVKPISENPFKEEKRDLPFEFPFKRTLLYAVNIELPAGYELEEKPAPVAVQSADKGINAYVNYNIPEEGKVQVLLKFDINRVFFTAEQYPALRSMYDKFVEGCNVMLIAKKK